MFVYELYNADCNVYSDVQYSNAHHASDIIYKPIVSNDMTTKETEI